METSTFTIEFGWIIAVIVVYLIWRHLDANKAQAALIDEVAEYLASDAPDFLRGSVESLFEDCTSYWFLPSAIFGMALIPFSKKARTVLNQAITAPTPEQRKAWEVLNAKIMVVNVRKAPITYFLVGTVFSVIFLLFAIITLVITKSADKVRSAVTAIKYAPSTRKPALNHHAISAS